MNTLRIQPTTIGSPLCRQLLTALYPPGSLRHTQTESIDTGHLISFYIVCSGETPLCYFALYLNEGLKYLDTPTLLIGNWECCNMPSVAQYALQQAQIMAQTKGVHYLIGPLNGSTWHNYRFSTSNDNPPFFTEPEQHSYYGHQFADNGFEVLATYGSYAHRGQMPKQNLIANRERHFRQAGIVFRTMTDESFDADLRKIYDLSLTAFANNFLYTPLAWDDFSEKYSKIKHLLKPELVLLAEDENEDLVGYFFAVHDHYQPNRIIVKTLAVKPGIKYAGMGSVLANMSNCTAAQAGYTNTIHAFITDTSISGNISRKTSVLYRQYLLYVCDVSTVNQ